MGLLAGSLPTLRLLFGQFPFKTLMNSLRNTFRLPTQQSQRGRLFQVIDDETPSTTAQPRIGNSKGGSVESYAMRDVEAAYDTAEGIVVKHSIRSTSTNGSSRSWRSNEA